ncbi:nose resistant to fluoxetine protein 6-like [Episyrphus balteatus]|uniref:nose resistant to fluoxetine protein 6-like n=1 Tax=Episyrphus balteatus TaxID=286459 RepID=UPI002485EABA|nr:nose resistant to fluoxetine protein 6-like [Episyrphus balteatus]
MKLPLDLGAVNIGICVPDSCSPEYLASIFQKSSDQYLEGSLKDISVEHCTDGKIEPLTTINIVAITIFGVATALMILSSIYEFCVDYYNKTPIPILLAFSMLTNGKRLFAINTKRSRNSIDCFNGLRVLSTLWIMNHHMYANIYGTPMINEVESGQFQKTVGFMFFITAPMSVDTFFFIGGCLVAWTGFRDLDKSNGKINVFMNIVHRYIRLTPVVAIGLLLQLGIHSLLFTGPFKYIAQTKCDGTNWWPILLYIQNYYFPTVRCYEESWYLAVDFHLYALSPLILIPMWKWGKKFIPVVCALIAASVAWVFAVFIMSDFTGMFIGINQGEWEMTYVPTHTRCAPWLMGFVFGYFIHYHRQSNFRISGITQLLLWIGSLGTLLSIVLLPYFPSMIYGSSVFQASMYEGLKRVGWATALTWISFSCYYGLGGFIDAFLSHPFWQPLSRLTYALYLTHMAIEKLHFGSARTPIYFTPYNQFLYFWSAFGISLLLSIYITLAFESPIMILEKFIFGGNKPVAKKVTLEEQPTHTIAMDQVQKVA